MFISQERQRDIKERGKNCLVYDLDGKKVKLCEAKVWFNNKGDYYYPIEVHSVCDICIIS
tara:strand:- start:37751 stop:37930 length:180 start_codon:yes stop_codon:yes gene_type:complete